MFALHILLMITKAFGLAVLSFPVIYFISVIYSTYNQKEISDIE